MILWILAVLPKTSNISHLPREITANAHFRAYAWIKKIPFGKPKRFLIAKTACHTRGSRGERGTVHNKIIFFWRRKILSNRLLCDCENDRPVFKSSPFPYSSAKFCWYFCIFSQRPTLCCMTKIPNSSQFTSRLRHCAQFRPINPTGKNVHAAESHDERRHHFPPPKKNDIFKLRFFIVNSLHLGQRVFLALLPCSCCSCRCPSCWRRPPPLGR